LVIKWPKQAVYLNDKYKINLQYAILAGENEISHTIIVFLLPGVNTVAKHIAIQFRIE